MLRWVVRSILHGVDPLNYFIVKSMCSLLAVVFQGPFQHGGHGAGRALDRCQRHLPREGHAVPRGRGVMAGDKTLAQQPGDEERNHSKQTQVKNIVF